MPKFVIPILLLSLIFAATTSTSEAAQYRSRRSRSTFGYARPVTGYGSNIHRNFILKQEARRAAQGKAVRNRGNILWYRYR